jgi:hypothetical protein
VRWDDGRVARLFPGSDASVRHFDHKDRQARTGRDRTRRR